MNRVFDIAVLFVWGAIVADLVTHPQGTKGIVDGLSGAWSNGLKAVNPAAGF